MESLEDRRLLTTFVVNNVLDARVDAPGDVPGSLRQAIFDANANPGVDAITFEPTVFADGAASFIRLTQSEMQVTESVDIIGPGASELTISGNGVTSIFHFGDETGASTFHVSGLTLADGFNGPGNGGAILFDDAGGAGGEDTLNISDAVIRDNSARFGGGVHVVLGTLNITDTALTNNTARNATFLQGGGALSLEQSDTTLERVTITGNTAADTGGAINSFARAGSTLTGNANLTIIDSNISGNQAPRAGGIGSITRTAAADTSLSISGSTISGNVATAADSGGIRADGAVVTIFNSTLSGNRAGGSRDGGAIFTANSDLVIANSTLSGNSTTSDSGAIHAAADRNLVTGSNSGQSTTEIVNSTIAFNSDRAGTVTAEARAGASSEIRVSNSIFSDNGDRNFNTFGAGQALIVSDGFNISDDNSSNLNGAGDQINTDPLLFALADNGGLTQTHALQLGSPAIDAGSNALAVDANGVALATDQRGVGFARILDGSVDVGAFESELFQGELIVSTNTDVVDTDFSSGELSLREAVLIANQRSGVDTINFDSALNGQTITVVASELKLSESVSIVGPGVSKLTISGGDATGIFHIGDEAGASTFSISGLTLSNGNGVYVDDANLGRFGGAIQFFDQFGAGGEDTLNLSDAVISGSEAVLGGGLHSVLGTVNVTDTTFTGNTATSTAGTFGGGGLSLQQTDATLQRVLVTDNVSLSDGGGIVNVASLDTANLGDANLTIIDSTITNNIADGGGGIKNIATNSLAEANLNVSGSTISGNRGNSLAGGGISSVAGVVSVSDSLISDNVGRAGGGIFARNADLRVENTTLSGNNSGTNNGGAIRLQANRNNDPDGLGLNQTEIVNSTIAFNTSGGTGAIVNQAGGNSTSIVTMQNSIFSNNNGSPNFGVANSGGTISFTSAGHNISDDSTGNLVAVGDQINTDPLLFALADNGGLTQTHALQAGSPAIDAGSNALAVDANGVALATDQRGFGFARILDGAVDVGAFETELFQGELIVSTNTDVVDTDFSSGELSLREAVLIANQRSGIDTISFDSALNGQTITVTSELKLSESVNIVGPGASQLTISGGDATGIFHIGDEAGASTFSISGLTLSNGNGVYVDDANLGRFGGAIQFFDQFGAGGEDTLNLSNAVISGSEAVLGGGLHSVLGTVNVTDTTFTGNTATSTSGTFGGGGLSLQQTDATLQRVFVTDNVSLSDGGGIVNVASLDTANLGNANLTIIDSTITGNIADGGGGIKNIATNSLAEANLNVSGSTISGNRGNSLAGGGISSVAGVVSVSDSLISDNFGRAGGGIFARNAILRVENTTLSGNNSGSNNGGAIRLQANRNNDPDGLGLNQTEIVNSTIAFNTSSGTGAIVNQAGVNSTSFVTMQNSIFSNNNGSPNFGVVNSGGTISFNSAGHNISDDTSGNLVAAGDQINTDPLLFALADNGGPTRTHALGLESPAIDAGSNALAVDANGVALATDQRGTGFGRILDGTVDVGAFESELFQGDLIVSANTDVVDNNFSSGELSLREAVLIANARPGFDSISFDSALNSQTITLTEGVLQVTESTDFVGPGALGPDGALLSISGDNNSTIFWFGDTDGASTFNVSGLRFLNGNGVSGASIGNFGGALLFFDDLGAGGEDTLNITDTIVVDSTAVLGGGLHAALGTLNVTDTNFARNTATSTAGTFGGGGLSLQQTDATLERVTVTDNVSLSDGGGIANSVSLANANLGDANLTIVDSTITNNIADGGGGIKNVTTSPLAEANLNVSGSTISGNRGNSLAGGGISSIAGVVSVSESLISDNVGAAGGGIFGRNADLRVENTTLSGNDSGTNNGGAIRLQADRNNDPDGLGLNQTEIVNSTIAFNTSGGTGAIVNQAGVNSTSIVTMQNSIFSNNNGSPNFGVVNSGGTISFTSAGHNISDDSTGNLVAAGDQINTDPLLFALADNGGLTQTHALQIGSPAIDAGSNALAVDAGGNPLTTDQRGEGFARILDGTPPTVDIGAFENKTFEGDLIVSENSDVVDGLTGAGQLSLREAVLIANDRPGFDSIAFDAALNGQTITLTEGVLQVTESTDFVGPGALGPGGALLSISGNNNSTIFWFGDTDGASTFNVSGLRFVDGNGVSGASIGNFGGAFLFFDDLGAGGEDTLNITDTIVVDSTAVLGGGLHAVLGTVNLTDTNLARNTATANGGEFGGGALSLQQTDATLERVLVAGNNATNRGGGIANFVGAGTANLGDANLTIIDSTITNNTADGGGGILNLTLVDSAVANANLTVSGTTISGNRSVVGNFFAGGSGGGILTDSGAVTISNSTLFDNSADGGGSNGGAIFAANADLNIENSTLSGNNATVAGEAVFVFSRRDIDPDNTGQSVATIDSSTVAFNDAGTSTLFVRATGGTVASLTSSNSIFANNASTNNFATSTTGNGVAAIVSNGFNISDDNTGNLTAAGDQSNTDPLLAPLADNGGRTQTHALQTGSPAIDAGNSTLATDQRGVARPTDLADVPNATGSNGSDIGAYEIFSGRIVVDTNLDVVNAFDGLTSLREAIGFGAFTPDQETITFDPSLSGATIQLQSGTGDELLIDNPLVIDASSLTEPITVVGNGTSRVINFVDADGDLTINGLTISGGVANSSGGGGGIRFASSGEFNVLNSTISNNTAGAGRDGAGILVGSNGSLVVNNSVISNNTAGRDGGGIFSNNGSVSVINTTISGNSSGDDGGGIFTNNGSVSVTNSTISENSSSDNGGGIFSSGSSSSVSVSNTTISENSSGVNGGGIFTNNGSVSVTNSTISGNSASADGGGLRLNTSLSGNIAQIINSTISGNTAGQLGGAIFNFDGLTRITSSTLTGNNARIGGGVSTFGDGVTRTEVASSIIAGNTSTEDGADVSSQSTGFANSFVSLGFNLIGDGQFGGVDFFTDADNGNQVGTTANPLDPLLKALADNGGPTLTHALRFGSPAIDAGNSTLTTDQRGVARPLEIPGIPNAPGSNVSDIGAVELGGNGDWLTLTVGSDSYSENDGTILATVTNAVDLGTEQLTLSVQLSDTSELSGPSTVTIPAGASTVSFVLSTVDDDLRDGTQTVEVTVTSDLLGDASQAVEILDSESLTVSIQSESITEDSTETVTGVVSRGQTDLGSAIEVSLTSSDTSEATVPASVIIPAGQSSVEFEIQAVDDAILDGTQVVQIVAAGTGFTDAIADSLSVLDAEFLTLTLDRTEISENGGSAELTVARSDVDNSQELVVLLDTNDTSEVALPSSVTIPAGASSAVVTVQGVDDQLFDSTQLVELTASAGGFSGDSIELRVLDDENPFHNSSSPFDVNTDGFVSPIDALLVINLLNRFGGGPTSNLPTAPDPQYIDVNNDLVLSPIDSLLVINELNNQAGEGESALDADLSLPLGSGLELQHDFALVSLLEDLELRKQGKK